MTATQSAPAGAFAWRRWLRRLLYAGLLFVWLVVMLLPLSGMILAVKGEIRWDRGLARDRLFMVQERLQRGVGWEAVRPLARADDGTVFVETTVRYYLWKGAGTGQNTRYVECYGGRPDGGHDYLGPCQFP